MFISLIFEDGQCEKMVKATSKFQEMKYERGCYLCLVKLTFAFETKMF